MYKASKSVKRRTAIKYLIGLVLLLVISGVAYEIKYRNVGPIPPDLKQQFSFLVYYPTGKGAAVDKTSIKYDEGSKAFSFKMIFKNVNLTVAEQSTPQNFVDIPEAYGKLIDSLNSYKDFDSLYGKVSLTHPKEFNGEQSAVMNAKGTLMFVHPTSGSLSDDQWRQLFNNLQIIK